MNRFEIIKGLSSLMSELGGSKADEIIYEAIKFIKAQDSTINYLLDKLKEKGDVKAAYLDAYKAE